MKTAFDSPDKAHVVINLLHYHQQAAEYLLQILMAAEEGMDCTYHVQLSRCMYEPYFMRTLIDFMDRSDVRVSIDLPDLPFPEELVDQEVESSDGQPFFSKGQRGAFFEHSLCMLKYGRMLDSFLLVDPACQILKSGWLRTLHEEKARGAGPVMGHLRFCRIAGQPTPYRWSTAAWYEGGALRETLTEEIFRQRRDNPFWLLREEADHDVPLACFQTPWLSAFDLPFDFLYFTLQMSKNYGPDPKSWPVERLTSRGDLFVSGQPAERDEQSVAPNSTIIYNIMSNEINAKMLRLHSFAAGNRRAAGNSRNLQPYPLSGPRYNLIGNNERRLDIDDLKDLFIGERCFIIGNGPSLKKTDLSWLKHEYAIGLNRIYLNYENMGFEPTFLCVANPHVIEQFQTDFNRLQSIKFMRYDKRHLFCNRWNTFFMESYGYHDFNSDLSDFKWCEGTTVTYCAMQLAFYLGFSEVILVGVDHSFSQAGSAHQLVTAKGDDPNHFHPDYFGKGIKWQYPDLARSEISYRIAKDVYEKDGRRLLDATVDGKLEVFPKVEYATLF